jgi:hypothetical protein
MHKRSWAIVGAVLLLAPLGVSQGKGNSKGQGHNKDKGSQTQTQASVTYVEGGWTRGDIDVIQSWYKAIPPKGLPPGLAKKGKIPPGIAKQIACGQRIPDGVVWEPFPSDLARRLPPVRPGFDQGFIEGRAVIWNKGTRVVMDVLSVF